MAIDLAMAGSSWSTFVTCATTSAVRFTDAPAGSCASRKNAPWSSSGRKPVGTMRAKQHGERDGARHEQQRQHGEAHERTAERHVAVAHLVDQPRQEPQDALRLAVRRQHQRAQRRR